MTQIPSPLLLVTDRHQVKRPLERIVAEAVGAGARWVWLRDRDLDLAERRGLALRLANIVQSEGGVLSIGGDIGLAIEIGAAAVHVRDTASVIQARQAQGQSILIGLSAHNVSDVASARLAGADYVTLSPIFQTASKPGYGPALGVEAIRLAARLDIAVVGLGGISTDNVAAVQTAGASGIAIMGSVMRADNPAEIVRAMLRRWEIGRMS
jgi:thiamine-phosphate pyrophosphorylase